MRKLLLICLAALALRLGLLGIVSFPGIADPNHYYNLALRIVEGHGFTADTIWQYSQPPPGLVHPETHWMPMASFLAAGSMAVIGRSVDSALLPFVLLGALLPALGYWAACQLELSERAALFSAAAIAVLPEMAIYSLRTDTVIPAASFTCLSLLLLTRGLRDGAWLPLIGSGLTAGLAYLTRNDAVLLLPTLLVALVGYAVSREGPSTVRWRALVVIPLAAVVVAGPWLARNLQATGQIASAEIDDMFFFTDHNDHYAYARHFTLQTMLAVQGPTAIVGKRFWELAAAFKVMTQTLQGALSVAVAGGLALLCTSRDRRRLLTLAPALVLLLGLLVAYPILIPYKSQAGSFKKAFVSIVPMIIPLGAYALERAITETRLRLGAMALIVALAGATAIDAVRLEAQFVDVYRRQVDAMAQVARRLPDTNGDAEIVLMAQDPFILRFVGLRSVVFPDEDRDSVLEIARRYGVDYLLMPANRASLDPLLTGEVEDPRFVRVTDVPGTTFAFFGIQE